ncbi:hypothetical protein [Glaciimonas sp. PCH181]|uniref:hypothetical protein n=1 Tax=Glaciimonas sp. PCH181 TaxID=2133943 RepID=UPI0011B1CCD8|nr:hypothetical protein [Glaciimonas sp. PCH181]
MRQNRHDNLPIFAAWNEAPRQHFLSERRLYFPSKKARHGGDVAHILGLRLSVFSALYFGDFLTGLQPACYLAAMLFCHTAILS